MRKVNLILRKLAPKGVVGHEFFSAVACVPRFIGLSKLNSPPDVQLRRPTVGHSPPTTRDTVFVSVAANDGLSGGKCFSWVRSLFPPGLITCGNCGVSLPEKGRVLIGRNGFPRGG